MVAERTVDLELIAQRVLKLAEIATLDHLQGLLDSQAEGLLSKFDAKHAEGEHNWGGNE